MLKKRRQSSPKVPSQASKSSNNDELEREDIAMLAPQLKLAADESTLLVDSSSLLIETTEVKENRTKRQVLKDAPPVVENDTSLRYKNWSGQTKPGDHSKRWTEEETDRFFLALQMLRTNFYSMEQIFPNRRWQELKKKFKFEEKRNPERVAFALSNKIVLDAQLLMENVATQSNVDTQGSRHKKPAKAAKTKPAPLSAAQRKRLLKKYKKDTDAQPPVQIPPIEDSDDSAVPLEPTLEKMPVPTICNIVAGINLGVKIDVFKLTKQLNNAEYNRKFAAASLRIGEPKTTATVFSNGKLRCAGARSIKEALVATRKFAKLIQVAGNPQIKFLGYRIENIVAFFDVKFPIYLEEIVSNHSQDCKQVLIHSVTSSMTKPNVTLQIFRSGKITVLGAKSCQQINEAIEKIYPS